MLKTSMCDYEKLSVVICPIYSHFANLAIFNCLTVRYVLLQYSVACTIGSLSFLFISFLYLDRIFINKFGIFHANQTSMCLDPHQS